MTYANIKAFIEAQLEEASRLEGLMMSLENKGVSSESDEYLTLEVKWNDIRSQLLNFKDFVDANVGEFM